MHNLKPPVKDIHTEEEAAEALNISLPTLHCILDQHIFNDGTPRPEKLQFTSSDLILMEFWRDLMPNCKVVTMPRRN